MPTAQAAVIAIEQAAHALAHAVRAWHAEEQEQQRLLRPVPGHDGREIADLGPIHGLSRDIGRALDSLPYPVPRMYAPQADGQQEPAPADEIALRQSAGGGGTVEFVEVTT
jgi:hypothetical protein